MERKTKIQTVSYESEEGIIPCGMKKGCFGAWVAVRNNQPIGTMAIRPLQWLPNVQTTNS